MSALAACTVVRALQVLSAYVISTLAVLQRAAHVLTNVESVVCSLCPLWLSLSVRRCRLHAPFLLLLLRYVVFFAIDRVASARRR